MNLRALQWTNSKQSNAETLQRNEILWVLSKRLQGTAASPEALDGFWSALHIRIAKEHQNR